MSRTPVPRPVAHEAAALCLFCCPRCGHGSAIAVRPGTAFGLYCRPCRVRLVPAGGPDPAGGPAVRYGGYTFGPRSEDGHAA